MANENFGLSFTIQSLALWADPQVGTQGPYGEIAISVSPENQGPHGEFAPVISSEAQGAFGEIAYVFDLETQGAHGEFDALGICLASSVLSAPGQSTLSGPGVSIATCP